MTHPTSAAFISYLLIIDFCRVVPRLCYLKFSHFPLKPLLSRPQVNFRCLTQWSMFSCYFFLNLLAAFIRVVHFLLPEKKCFTWITECFSFLLLFHLQFSHIQCVTFVSGFIQIPYFLLKYLFSSVACGILVPSPGMEPVESLKHWISRKIP